MADAGAPRIDMPAFTRTRFPRRVELAVDQAIECVLWIYPISMSYTITGRTREGA
jgi:hypothetical protein